MAEVRRKKAIAANTVYTIAGALVLNGVLQLFVYPRAAAAMGTAAYGNLLYIMALVNILGPSIGQALNNSRLVMRREYPVSNGDYFAAVLLMSAAGILCSVVYARNSLGGGLEILLLSFLILLTDFRYYGDVEYRLSLNYRRYFFYYTICGAGYALGYLIGKVTGIWQLIFLTGEAVALCFVAVTGCIFRNVTVRSPHFPLVMRRGGMLVLSYFVTNLTLNMDRLFLKGSLGEEAVAVYYVVSLIGKTLVLFVAPVNTIVISYLTKDKETVTRRRFLLFAGAGILAAAVFFAGCMLVTPLFIRLVYPQLVTETAPLVPVVTLMQILAMLSAYLFIVVLTYTGAKWQLALQLLHLVILMLLITWMTPGGGLPGFSAGVLIANAIRILLVLTLGFIKAGRGK